MNDTTQNSDFSPDVQTESTRTFEEVLHSLLNEALTSIKATGGSVMLMDSKKKWLVIHARLGPPRPERHREPRFRINDKSSIAGYVVSTAKAYFSPDVIDDPHFAPSRSGQPQFRSLLCAPILAADKVLGVINADHEETNFFTDKDRLQLFEFAKRLSGYVKEHERLWRVLYSLHNVGASLAGLSPEGQLKDVLNTIAEQALNLLDADLVTLYQYDQDRQLFLVQNTGPTVAGSLFEREPMHSRVYLDAIPSKIIIQGEPRYFLNVDQEDFLIGKLPARDDIPERPRFAVREKLKSVAALVLKAGKEKVGVMFANYRSSHKFTPDEKRILETFANSAAIAIKNARLLEALKQIQEQRLAAERWATLGKAVANLAHRINNTAGLVPVAVQDIQELFAQLSVTDEQKKQIQGNLERIERNTRFTLDLADVLLKPFTGGPAKQIDINKLIKQALNISPLPEQIQIDLTLSPNLPTITTSYLLVDVFIELISNAAKAMPDGGHLEIGTRLASTDWVEIWFTDEGVGIPPENQTKVFDLFFTSSEKSLGFGLWWVNTFVLQQGGTIKLKSKAEQGTTFTIRLPVHHSVETS